MLRTYVNPKLISRPNITSACLYSLYLKRGSASGGREEGRAPSTAEEFTRQGVASQTVEKTTYDRAEATTNVSSNSEAEMEKVRKEYQEKKESRDHLKKGSDDDDDDLPINTSKGT
ncbi:hypothetical protein BRARA_J00966 [Brassica rapa]|uniref:BnaA10g09390D protein n=3 Tax=Brassica TaxID=3705 RepID=A0A078FRZ4_BRANA|nr:uncharacterized protein LOC106370252 [Brassica napus]RID40970.1 hypothetical protein BRARA_J00966 [Brassica rapa]KAH0906508.1 hypothetical protein HID58_038335 [Brassica napus]CAF2327542.1 unnamed protein product [Brassica napus]CAG7910052.1 unnamed protein product [Brassica rapa]CDY17305.1 BnaA10g09390D [Brassica napus]